MSCCNSTKTFCSPVDVNGISCMFPGGVDAEIIDHSLIVAAICRFVCVDCIFTNRSTLNPMDKDPTN